MRSRHAAHVARSSVRPGDEQAVRQGAARPPAPVVDRAKDADVAPGLVIPDGANLDLILRPRTAPDLDVVLAIDPVKQLRVGSATPATRVRSRSHFASIRLTIRCPLRAPRTRTSRCQDMP